MDAKGIKMLGLPPCSPDGTWASLSKKAISPGKDLTMKMTSKEVLRHFAGLPEVL